MTNCMCPSSRRGRDRCQGDDQTHDPDGVPLCCPFDDRGMAAYYREPLDRWSEPAYPKSGKRSAMRKRLHGDLEEIAQRAADSRR
jgi:hypothetical protein